MHGKDAGVRTRTVANGGPLWDEDLSNFTAIHALRHGNTVYALRWEDLPTGSYLAAIYHLLLLKHFGKRP